ncbi:hypothetical protein PVAND_011058 [Polypedilum vanderplanki]|uniref:Origin recognition complex subunit 1 n=1 Tax=Polypedilum vanderplanki TaxID=319348 RepID=A0A9J6CIU6_POLVA|nr:hypothetical protein PVAND_011058 [Polypedilum vanderplanki]
MTSKSNKDNLPRAGSSERLGLIFKQISNEHLDPKSPRKWSVELKKIYEDPILSSIENQANLSTPKRRRGLISKSNETTPIKSYEATTPKSTRRSRVLNKIEEEENHEEKIVNASPPKRTRRNSALVAITKINDNVNEMSTDDPCTPTIKEIPARRKSILKTPTASKSNTPRRSIQFSAKIEEYEFVKKSAKKRVIDEDGDIDMSGLAVARKRLHVSAVPKSLPCREKEYMEIYSFLESNLNDQIGGCIYISGVPGTGKTATTTAVIRALKAEAEKGEIPDFEFVEINGMRITEPRKAYVEIYRQLSGKTVTAEQAYNLLDKRFTTTSKSSRRISTILLVDELDILCNKRQDVVYNLLNWPNVNSARLIVVTIANTMDLPERILMGKVTSRLGLTRLTFQPYSHKQLQEIVISRLSGLDSFNNDAIQLVARKVAALSGDARRALDICRRSSEIAEVEAKNNGNKAFVAMTHVQQALNEMISCTKVKAVKACSKMEKYFLQAVCMEVERTGLEEVTFYGVYKQMKTVTTLNGLPLPTTATALAISMRLGASRLIISEHTRKDIYQKILLNINVDDFYYATQVRLNDEE